MHLSRGTYKDEDRRETFTVSLILRQWNLSKNTNPMPKRSRLDGPVSVVIIQPFSCGPRMEMLCSIYSYARELYRDRDNLSHQDHQTSTKDKMQVKHHPESHSHIYTCVQNNLCSKHRNWFKNGAGFIKTVSKPNLAQLIGRLSRKRGRQMMNMT